MPSDGSAERADDGRPAGWPETFADPDAGCCHQYHWDDEDEVYRCVYCDDERDEPPIACRWDGEYRCVHCGDERDEPKGDHEADTSEYDAHTRAQDADAPSDETVELDATAVDVALEQLESAMHHAETSMAHDEVRPSTAMLAKDARNAYRDLVVAHPDYTLTEDDNE